MAIEAGRGVPSEVAEEKERQPIPYDDPEQYLGDLQNWPQYQEIKKQWVASRPNKSLPREEVEQAFLDSDVFKDTFADFFEAGNQLRYVSTRYSQEFNEGLSQYFQTMRELRRLIHRPGIGTDDPDVFKRNLEKMNEHEALGEMLAREGKVPSKAAGREIVRLLSIDTGHDDPSVLRGGDIQRRRSRQELSSVSFGE